MTPRWTGRSVQNLRRDKEGRINAALPGEYGFGRAQLSHPGFADLVCSAIEREDQVVTWAVENGVELVEPCACRARTGASGCVCNVEVRVGRRWMRAAKEAVALANAPDGPIPQRICRLCRAGDHDQEPRIAIPVQAPDGSELPYAVGCGPSRSLEAGGSREGDPGRRRASGDAG